MKTLSIRSPYAEQIISGEKVIEFRSWKPKFRGRFLVHRSGKGGGIIGSVELFDVTGEPGDYEWHLREPIALPFCPCKGRLNLWEFEYPASPPLPRPPPFLPPLLLPLAILITPFQNVN